MFSALLLDNLSCQEVHALLALAASAISQVVPAMARW